MLCKCGRALFYLSTPTVQTGLHVISPGVLQANEYFNAIARVTRRGTTLSRPGLATERGKLCSLETPVAQRTVLEKNVVPFFSFDLLEWNENSSLASTKHSVRCGKKVRGFRILFLENEGSKYTRDV